MARSYAIGVIPGDGIGPEVIDQGLKVLTALADIDDFRINLLEYPWSSQYYLDTGELMTEAALDEYRTLDAIYLGALGDPRVERGLVERSVIMTLRLGLDLYINLRPIVLYAEHLCPIKGVQPEDVNMIVVRENTEDVYVGIGGRFRKDTPQEVAIAEMVYTRQGVERAVRYAFKLAAGGNSERKVTLIDKSNAIRPQEIWRSVFAEVATEYPGVQTDALYVDAATMLMVSDPKRFDVIVTTNLFGDIITDLGAVIQGGMGSAASGNLHPGAVSMFEPVHGSAPDIAGRGIASPIGAVTALGMMLQFLGEVRAAQRVERAVGDLLRSRRIPNLGAASGLSSEEAGNLIVGEIQLQAARS